MMFVPRIRLWLAGWFVLALSACAIGPDYTRPDLDTGTQYKQTIATDGWVMSQEQPGLRSDWWLLFNDATLNGLMVKLNQDNLSLAQAQAQYQQAQALLQSSRSGFFPNVTAASSNTRSGAAAANSVTATQHTLSGTVSWEPDIWGKVRRDVESSQAGLLASEADLANIRLSMQSSLAQTYFRLRIMTLEKDLLAKTVQAYQQSLQMTQNRYQAGVVAQTDVANSQVQLQNAKVQLLTLGWQSAQLEHALAVLLGQAPASFVLSPEHDFMASVPKIPVGLPSLLLQRRPDIAAAERRTAQANARIGVAQAAWLPDITLSAQGGYRSGSWAQWLTSPASFWSLGPALALTIFDGGAREARIAEMRAAYDAQAASYRLTVLTALREVEDYLVQRHTQDLEQEAQDQALQAARLSLQLTENQYQAGMIDYLSVVQVQTSALNTERATLSLVADRLVTSVQLIAALGGGWQPEPVSENLLIN